MPKDCVFTVADGEFQVLVGGRVVPGATWDNRGAALAGLAVERRRAAARAARESRHVVDGLNVEFQGARPARAGEDY